MDAIDALILRDGFHIARDLTRERIADDLLRAMTLLGCDVVVNSRTHPADPHTPSGGASLQTKNVCTRAGESPANPASETVSTMPDSQGRGDLPHWSGSVGQQPIHDKPAPVHAETDQGGTWHPSSEWREACRDDIERRINL